MTGKCKDGQCGAPEVPCHVHGGDEDYKTCENFIWEKVGAALQSQIKKISNGVGFNWSGEALNPDDLQLISNRNSPYLIGTFGKADAGKTTYLAMVFTLLLNGHSLRDYEFAGSKTILGWDKLYHRLMVSQGQVDFPPPTSVGSNRLYHLALRGRNDRLLDLLFADASGEVFSLWGINRNDDTADSARWIYANANAFMLFIDCDALLSGKNIARREVMLIARQMKDDLHNRPIIAVWSKADKKGEVLPAILNGLKAELNSLFNDLIEIEISNFLEPGPDELVHRNNLAAIDHLLEWMVIPSNANLTLTNYPTEDSFLKFRRR